jgi:hypothetical protein
MLTTLLAIQVAAAVTSPPPVVYALENDPVPSDKAAHFAVSYGCTLTGALLLEKAELPRWQAVAIASAGTFLVGLAKEVVYDPEISGWDLVADGLGVTVAAGVVFAFRF